MLSPAEENPCSNGNGQTAKPELNQKRENGLSASNGGTVRLKFAQGFPKTEVQKENTFIETKHLSAIKSIFIEHLRLMRGLIAKLKTRRYHTSIFFLVKH